MNHLHRSLLRHCVRDPLRMNEAHYCDLSQCDDRVEALNSLVLACRMNELDARCDLLGVMCALAYRMFALAYRMNVLDARCDQLGAQNAQCALANGALGAHCDLKQTSLHGSLALDGHPFRIRALMPFDVDCPLVHLQFPSTLSRFPFENVLHEAWIDLLSASPCELQELHRDQSSELSKLA